MAHNMSTRPGEPSRMDQDDSPPGTASGKRPEMTTVDQSNIPDSNKAQSSLKTRKRTKTGCLTCRRRRIKCGEERPTCANCIKSKRSCEGYAPRLTFKDPLGAFRPGWAVRGNGAQYQIIQNQVGNGGAYGRPQPGIGASGQLPIIAPRPLPPELPEEFHIPPQPTASSHVANESRPSNAYAQQTPTDLSPQARRVPQRQDTSSTVASNIFSAGPVTGSSASSSSFPGPSAYSIELTDYGRPPNSSWSQTSVPKQEDYYRPSNTIHDMPQDQVYTNAESDFSTKSIPSYDYGNQFNSSNPSNIQNPASSNGTQAFNMQHNQGYPAPNDGYIDSWSNQVPVQNFTAQAYAQNTQIPYESYAAQQTFIQNTLRSSQQPMLINQGPSVDDPDDDYFDVVSDEEEEDAGNTHRIVTTPQSDLGLMLALSASRDDRVPRSYTAFLHEPNMLATYHPDWRASPLMDSTTARIFCHYITATGPSLSIFERLPANPTVMFTGAPVPSSQQALWTYILPMMALSDQALLHAMLALASLHIAKLQNSAVTSSLRHYHFALKRIAKAVALPTKRTNIATIAATLILSFYEASTAEHSKWNSHLIGARQLLMELDFKGMTKRIKEEKKRTRHMYQEWQNQFDGYAQYYSFLDNQTLLKEEDVDERMISELMGINIRYDQHGRVIPEDEPPEIHKNPITPKEIETYRIYADLFWWYCKQDVYQSIISGNRLLLPYDRWGHCPPRAPLGRLDAIYGTMDHLVLLMGRVADFSSRDQLRKRRVVEANGGQWRPPPGFFPGGPPPGPPPPQNPTKQGPPQPMMYGMMPNPPKFHLPEAFTSAPRDKLYFEPPQPSYPSSALETATREAEQEWKSIQAAMEYFEESLSPDFSSLAPDVAPPSPTPFNGDTIEYRTYSIACIWVMYYTGRIIATRMHPSMPPAAMMAAGVAAKQTAEWAQRIGRICAGLQPPRSNQPLNPTLGAALMESTLGLFFGGIQYQNSQQRAYTVQALRNIARLTGWQSSALIAAGCETSWIRMADAGRGPPYARTMNMTEDIRDERVIGGRPVPEGERGLVVFKDDDQDKRMIYINPGTRVHWAMGIMSMEEDFRGLSVS